MTKKKNEKALPIDQLEKIFAGVNRLAGLGQAAQAIQGHIEQERQQIAIILNFTDISPNTQFQIDFKAGKVRW